MTKELGSMLKDLVWVKIFRKKLIHLLAGEDLYSD
jgi:hypothetical protein